MKHFYALSVALFLTLFCNYNAGAQCGLPSGFLISNITTTSADFTWNAVAGASSYEGVLTQTPYAPFSGTPLPTNSGSGTNLYPATLYYVHVRAICNGIPSGWLTSSFTTLGGSLCQKPGNLSIYGIQSTSAYYSWTPVSGAVNYEATISGTPTPPFSAPAFTTTNLVSNNTLSPNTIYYFHFRTNCGSGYSDWTTQVFYTTVSGYSCNVPTNLNAGNIKASTADLTWSATPGAYGYEYVVGTSNTEPTAHGTATTAPGYNATGLTPNTNYFLWVRTHCGGVEYSNWVYKSFKTDVSCNPPAGFSVNGTTTNTADISWNAAAGVSGYEYAYTTSSTPPASGNPTSALNVTLSGLNPATTYYAHVRSNCNGTDFSSWTTKTLFTQFPSSVSTVNNSNSITVYPNPVTDVLTIKTEGQVMGNAHIVITDMTGKIVRHMQITAGETRINTGDLPRGLYTLKYTDDARTQTIAVSKQ